MCGSGKIPLASCAVGAQAVPALARCSCPVPGQRPRGFRADSGKREKCDGWMALLRARLLAKEWGGN